MPYIRKAQRYAFKDLPRPLGAGELNYVITRLCHQWANESTHMNLNYDAINEIIGVLECVKLEYYRRIAAPYEDKKMEENGDAYGVQGL